MTQYKGRKMAELIKTRVPEEELTKEELEYVLECLLNKKFPSAKIGTKIQNGEYLYKRTDKKVTGHSWIMVI